MIYSLPGNHDLGFGTGIQAPVRGRFQLFFGEGNRVDVIGNHTFISVDAVSLSAMGQPDPHTGSSGTGLGDGQLPNEWLWRDSKDFLDHIDLHKARAESKELRMLNNQSEGMRYHSSVVDILEPTIAQLPEAEGIGLPSVLLTHIPLYRKAGTPCGPFREHYPPSSKEELSEDGPNSIEIGSGYQYQNVLTPTISNEIVSKVGPNLAHVYSGDDHDYCEISHREFNGSPNEITVKSISWAMGIRRPGFLLTSLWNPIDLSTGQSVGNNKGGPAATIQNHLCLLPDQLFIFIRYVRLLIFTLSVLLIVSAIAVVNKIRRGGDALVLPLSEYNPTNSASSKARGKSPSSSASSSTMSSPRGLARRASYSTSRYGVSYGSKVDPARGNEYGLGYGYGNANGNGNGNGNSYDSSDTKWKDERQKPSSGPVPGPVPNFGVGLGSGSKGDSRLFAELMIVEMKQRVKYVAMVSLCWYIYLIWKW